MRIISLSGADGAGKTTLASRLEKDLRRADSALVVTKLWLRWNPRVTKPAASGASSTVDPQHEGHGTKRMARRLGLQKLWVSAALRSYRRQLALQLGSVRDVDIVLADRFALDFAADLIAGGVLETSSVPTVLTKLPRADLALVADVPDDVLLARLAPSDDPKLVIERAALYRELAAVSGAQLVDGRSDANIARIIETACAQTPRQ